jgi:hypothetical protein
MSSFDSNDRSGISVKRPEKGQVFDFGTTIELETADPSDAVSVDFLIDGKVVESVSEPPYKISIKLSSPGYFHISARMSRQDGTKIDSSSVEIGVSNPSTPAISRVEQHLRDRRDCLSDWSEALGKSQKTIKRYMKGGTIPNAYQTDGGHWRAPFSPDVLEDVRKKLEGKTRRRLFPRNAQDQRRGYQLAIVYALWLAVNREPLKYEATLSKIVVDYIDEPSNDFRPEDVDRNDPEWTECVTILEKFGEKQTALIAAYAQALIEQHAGDTREDIQLHNREGQARPFSEPTKNASRAPGKRKAKARRNFNRKSNKVLQHSIKEAKMPIRPWTVIRYWKWVVIRRRIQNQPLRIMGPSAQHDRPYILSPCKNLSKRTFYNWYSEEQRKTALQEAARFLFLRDGV